MVFVIVLVGILFMMALQDIRTQEIRGRMLVFYSVTGIFTAGIRFFGYGCTLAGADALLLGILLLILHRVSGDGVGTADFWILAGLPLFLDADTMWDGDCSVYALAAAYGIVYILGGKGSMCGNSLYSFFDGGHVD